eukprot:282521-Pyramimonas_sp.AAC.1
MVSRIFHACLALDDRHGWRPPSETTPCAPLVVSRICMPWTTVADSGRFQRPPPAHPLWCREYATPAMP